MPRRSEFRLIIPICCILLLFILVINWIHNESFQLTRYQHILQYNIDNIISIDFKEIDCTNITILENTLLHLKSLPRIPKLIHIIWPDKNVINSSFEMIKHGVRNLIIQNPEWKLIVHNYSDIDNRFKNTALLTHADYKLIRNAHIVEKTDAFRLILIYEVGGLYIDVDRVVNIPLDEVIHNNTKLMIPTYYDINFAIDLFASSPGNQLLLHAIELQWKIRRNGGKNGRALQRKKGWITFDDQMRMIEPFTKSLEIGLFGKRLKENKETDWISARTAINKTNNVIVTKKDVWCDGILVRPYDGCKQVQKQRLYDAYDIKAWAEQVTALWDIVTEYDDQSVSSD